MHVQIHLSELMLFVQPGDCRAGTGQRATSILAGIIKCPRNHVRGFHDYCLRAMFLHPCEIQLSWHSHLNLHYELKAPNVLHWNCQWSFGATFQASCIWSEWCCIITNSLIYCALTGYVMIEFGESDLTCGIAQGEARQENDWLK